MAVTKAYVQFIARILGLLHRRLQQSKTITFGSIKVRICPEVFNPATGRTTAFFIRHMCIPSGCKVLELGTGTGAIAAAAAKDAESVVSTDISPQAVQCAHITMKLNNVSDRVRILQGDLFSPIQNHQFNVILFNPPYLARRARTQIDRTWCAGPQCELISRFIGEARNHLTPEGNIQILFSSIAPLTKIITQIKEKGFKIEVLARGRLLGFIETLYLFKLS